MNSQSCPCSTAWWLENSLSFAPLRSPANFYVAGLFGIQSSSAGDGSFPLHIQTSFSCITYQIVDAVSAEGGLARQKCIPVLSWEVGL